MYLKYEKYIGHFEAKNAQNGSKMGSKIIIDLNNDNNQSSHRRCSVRKCVPRNFAKFTGKHLRQGLSLRLY